MRPALSLAHAWRGAARQAWVLRACLACCVCLMLAPAAVRAQGDCMADWPLWQQFKEHFVEPDGRVLNARAGRQQSTSEGQSYAMFFALVAGDRKTFDQLWRWTVDNLAHGQAERRLPAWIWGQDPDSKAWGVMDANSAADADLWFVYALLEAGRLWGDPAYVRQAQALLVLIQAQEVSELPDLGTMLLPGREFFYTPEQGTWRLNPSYLPVFLLRRLQQASPRGPWDRIADNTLRMLRDVAPHGLAPDWTVYRYADQAAGFVPDAQSGATGSYDAIRVYLWAGMTAAQDPLRDALLAALGGMARIVGAAPQGEPPSPSMPGPARRAARGRSAFPPPWCRTSMRWAWRRCGRRSRPARGRCCPRPCRPGPCRIFCLTTISCSACSAWAGPKGVSNLGLMAAYPFRGRKHVPVQANSAGRPVRRVAEPACLGGGRGAGADRTGPLLAGQAERRPRRRGLEQAAAHQPGQSPGARRTRAGGPEPETAGRGEEIPAAAQGLLPERPRHGPARTGRRPARGQQGGPAEPGAPVRRRGPVRPGGGHLQEDLRRARAAGGPGA
ncbi:Endoglucanase precursor [Castellaniella defragrans 65Phen]|uniref:cellulase n=1 Tax=Castellaniella defragrans (strain DSM 12143 / CCUG 39792 / 65Phen) TaxID=1437824 RepID=W8X5T2_CASD6|nr:Endoglucanase precursor [Castellaniella defragrans 65Phen]